jgi:hypothetical protein
MIEYIVYITIAFTIIHFVVSVLTAVSEDDNEELPTQRMADVIVKMEQHNNCWYGYYHQKNGGEVFVAQGNTFDEAVANCRERLNSKDSPYKFNLHFDRSS